MILRNLATSEELVIFKTERLLCARQSSSEYRFHHFRLPLDFRLKYNQ